MSGREAGVCELEEDGVLAAHEVDGIVGVVLELVGLCNCRGNRGFLVC